MASVLNMKEQDPAEITNPDAGRVKLFVDETTGEYATKDSAGVVVALKGADGEHGDPGDPGDPGLSAYDVAVAEGFVGDEAAWLASLVGPPGAGGLPEGGTTGQILRKLSDDDNDAGWDTLTAGDVGAPSYDAFSTFEDNTNNSISNLQTYSATIADLTTHTSDTDNPHAVTAAQVGAYSITEAEQAIADGIVTKQDAIVYTGTNQLMVSNATADGYDWLSVGDPLQVLRTNAAGDALEFADPSGGGSIDTNTLGVVNHGSTASTARPAGYTVVQWVGTVDPVNKVAGDIWLDMSGV